MDDVKAIDCEYVQDHDLVKSYLGGGLSEKEAEAFEAHYFACDRCWEEVNTANQIRASAAPASSQRDTGVRVRYPPPVARPQWRALALAAAVAVALLGGGLFYLRSRDQTGLQALAAAAGEMPYRRIEARLAGSFRHLPLEPVTRGENETQLPLDLRRAALEAQKRAEDHPTAESLHAAGLGHLLVGEVDQAIRTFQGALKPDSNNSQIWSDLSATFIARGDREDRPSDYALALEAAQRAVEPGDRPEAYFNRALALQRLKLRDAAIEAWRDYLRKDPDSKSPWRAEANDNLLRLGQRPISLQQWEIERRRIESSNGVLPTEIEREAVARFPQPTRDWIERDLLPRWGTDVAEKPPSDADKTLLLASRLSKQHAAVSGDRMLPDSIDAIERARRSMDQSLARLARAHRDYRQGRIALDALELTSARKYFESADSAFRESGSPFAGWTTFQLALCSYYEGDSPTAARSLEGLNSRASERGYTILLGRGEWVRGLINRVVGDIVDSTVHYQIALKCFQDSGEVENAAAVQSLLGENFDYLSSPDRGWKERSLVFEHLDGVFAPQRRHTILISAAIAALRQRLPRAALEFQNQALANTESWRDPVALAEGHLYRATIRSRLGEMTGASQDLAAAKRWIHEIGEKPIANRATAELLEQEAGIGKASTPGEAVASLSGAIERFRALQLSSRLPSLYLARSRALKAEGKLVEAEEDLSRGIGELEELRDPRLERVLRLSFFDQAADLFAEMIEIQWVQGRPERALEFAERARARDLLDALAGAVPAAVEERTPLTPQAIAERLDSGVALVYYNVLPNRLLTWVVSAGAIESSQQEVNEAEIESLAGTLNTTAHSSDSASFSAASERLYDILIRPIASSLPTNAALVLVPAGRLQLLPFSALRDRDSHQFLVEQHPIVVSPSGTVFLRSADRLLPWTPTKASSLLIFGSPNARRQDNGSLLPLWSAEVEAREIAAIYPNSVLEIGAQATRQRFLEMTGDYEIVHFAGHAYGDPAVPFASRLLLAPSDASDPGILQADEIAGTRFTKTRLAVLAACSTGVGLSDRVEGTLSLAWSFLAAGVPSVVTSLWDIDDQASRRLLVNFHTALAEGKDASVALREAQLALLHSRDTSLSSPASWAGYEVIGGVGTLAK